MSLRHLYLDLNSLGTYPDVSIHFRYSPGPINPKCYKKWKVTRTHISYNNINIHDKYIYIRQHNDYYYISKDANILTYIYTTWNASDTYRMYNISKNEFDLEVYSSTSVGVIITRSHVMYNVPKDVTPYNLWSCIREGIVHGKKTTSVLTDDREVIVQEEHYIHGVPVQNM